jgi:hypothetical protein
MSAKWKLEPPRSIGLTADARPKRVDRTEEQWRHVVSETNPTWTEAQILEEVERQLFATLEVTNKTAARIYKEQRPFVRAFKGVVNTQVLVAAMRRSLPGQIVISKLREPTTGRQTDRKMPAGIFTHIAWSGEHTRFEPAQAAFAQESRPLLLWAHDNPLTRCGSHAESSNRQTMQAMLDRHDDKILMIAARDALREIYRRSGKEMKLEVLVVDGTNIEAPVDQGPARSKAEDALMNGPFDMSTMSSHGQGKNWRGWLLLVLVDMATSLPVVWSFHEGSTDEPRHVEGLFKLLHEIWEPEELGVDFLVGDKGFDKTSLHIALEENWATHLITPFSGKPAKKFPFAASMGVPICPIHGIPMQQVWDEEWVDRKERERLGLAPGDKADMSSAVMRFKCYEKGCTAKRAESNWKSNPRLYPFLPHEGPSRRRAKRVALMVRRNVVESVFSQLKHLGVGASGNRRVNWYQNDQQMKWHVGMALLGLVLRRLVHLDSSYDEALKEAKALGLLAPPAAKLAKVVDITRNTQYLRTGASKRSTPRSRAA